MDTKKNNENSGSLTAEEIKIFNDENNKVILKPLKVFAIITAIAGVLALVFEVQNIQLFAFDIYLARLASTIISFVVLIVANTQFGKSKPQFLIHLLLVTLILSFGYIIYKVPEKDQSPYYWNTGKVDGHAQAGISTV